MLHCLISFYSSSIDINDKDRICSLKLYPGLFAMRNPDTIKSIKYNDKYYVITANEGGGKEYGDWEEEFKSNKLFVVSDVSSFWKIGCFFKAILSYSFSLFFCVCIIGQRI